MWRKDECYKFFKKTLGLEFDDNELEEVLKSLKQHNLSPERLWGDWNVGFTPLKLKTLLNIALERTQGNIREPRFKKVSEEIIPTIFFILLLRKLGYGRYLIISIDAPDIALVPYKELENRQSNKIIAIPLECTFFPTEAINNADGETNEQKIAKLLIEKKFSKRYEPQTILLATINAKLADLDIKKLSNQLLDNDIQPFHQVWIFCGTSSNNVLLAQLCPNLRIYEVNTEHHLVPLMY